MSTRRIAKMLALAVLTFVVGTLLIILILVMFPRSRAEITCYPRTFPEGEILKLESYEVKLLETRHSFQAVREFYSQLLESPYNNTFHASEDNEAVEVWTEEQVGEGNTLFECHNQLNSHEIEWGCIYLEERNAGTKLFLTWYVTPTDAPACLYSLDVPHTP